MLHFCYWNTSSGGYWLSDREWVEWLYACTNIDMIVTPRLTSKLKYDIGLYNRLGAINFTPVQGVSLLLPSQWEEKFYFICWWNINKVWCSAVVPETRSQADDDVTVLVRYLAPFLCCVGPFPKPPPTLVGRREGGGEEERDGACEFCRSLLPFPLFLCLNDRLSPVTYLNNDSGPSQCWRSHEDDERK